MDHSDKVALITGASGAIGKGIAAGIAADHRFEVVLVCRNRRKAETTVSSIKRQTKNERVRFALADLSRVGSIRELAEEWTGPLHVLVNNAATTPPRRSETPEGIELQFATNVLGYFEMITQFTEALSRSAPARVVNVASYWAGGLNIDDLEFRQRRYDNNSAYRQSKQADRMLTVTFAERLKPKGITVNACHPGDVNSTLSNSLGFGGHETPAQGAATPVWLATDPIGGDVTGHYFEHRRQATCQFAADRGTAEALYQYCLDRSGQTAGGDQ